MTLIFLAHGIAGYGIITGLLILGIILARLPDVYKRQALETTKQLETLLLVRHYKGFLK